MSNDVVIEAWNTVLYEKFTRYRHLFIPGYTLHSDAMLARHPYEPGTSVMDVGCGWGDTAITLANPIKPVLAAFGAQIDGEIQN